MAGVESRVLGKEPLLYAQTFIARACVSTHAPRCVVSRLPLPREGKGWPFRASAPCSRLSVHINSNSHALSSPVSVVFALIGNDALAGF
jgi:hypothetical protein